MTYFEFQQELLTLLQKEFGEDYTLTITPVQKNNQVVLRGLTIHRKGLNISPAIYLESFYDAYQSGSDFSQITAQIKAAYISAQPQENIDTGFFTDFSAVRPHICMKLIHYEKNEEFLKEIPHIRFLDLAVVFYYLFPITVGENATILIHQNHLSYWNTDVQTLYDLAKENSPKLLPYYLDDILSLLDPASLFAIPDSETPPSLYVLTNSDKLFGASVILYPHLLESIAKRMDCDFIILPSSIHEVLLIPDSLENKSLHYDAIIQEVNLTQLSQEEILSDHAYYYQRNSNSITDYKASHTPSPKPSMNNHTS